MFSQFFQVNNFTRLQGREHIASNKLITRESSPLGERRLFLQGRGWDWCIHYSVSYVHGGQKAHYQPDPGLDGAWKTGRIPNQGIRLQESREKVFNTG